ncbi:MAG: hypothetical protein ACK4TL_11500 [Hyphomicrobiaceae bacterium]
MRRRIMALLIATPALAMASPAMAQSGPLDGKSFEGTFLEKGKSKGDPDTLIFRNGRFRSVACDRYGYADAPYTAVVDGDQIRFEAETKSPRYGTLMWSGVVRGGRLESTALWLRQGKAPVENIVNATLKP